MTMNELIMETEMARVRQLNNERLRFEQQARESAHGVGLRHVLAATLVRLGGWIDGAAYERSAPVTVRREVVR